MFWCYSCSNNTQCPNSCSSCHSSAIEQVTANNNPKQFTPFVIQQEKEEPFYSFESLYRSAYQDLFDTVRQRRTQSVRRVNSNGNYEISFVIAVDTSEEDRVRGLSETEINQLEKKTVSTECTICQQTRLDRGFVLECGHQFHDQCLVPWITENGTCPTCRFKLVKE